MEVVKVKKDHVGRLILTKATGSYDSRDITELYKFPEGQAGQFPKSQLAEPSAVAPMADGLAKLGNSV